MQPVPTSKLRVAVVDTGIAPDHPDLAPVIGGARFFEESGAIRRDDRHHDDAGHGTAVAGLVSLGLKARVELLAVKVVDGERGSSARALAEAIGFAAAAGARVINVSLGVEAYGAESAARVEDACRAAIAGGAVIVAAAGPPEKVPLPAVLPEVIAVGVAFCGSDVLHAADDGHLAFLARGDLQRVAWIGGEHRLAQGDSFSAAHVSRLACRILLADPALDAAGVRAALEASTVHADATLRARFRDRLAAFYRRRTPAHAAFIRRAAIYPFNKEIHALVRFRDLAPFTLAAVADPPGMRRAGRDAGELLGEAPAGLVIRPDLEGALDDADTLILGHVEALGARHDPARLALLRGKHVFSLSRLDRPDLAALAAERGLALADPTVSRAEAVDLLQAAAPAGDRALDARLHRRARLDAAAVPVRHECPVLGVFGTSRSQGKLSVQLALRRALAARGYRVGQLATEPTGALLGASATLPLGHERGDRLGLETDARLARILVAAVKNEERPDILLVGGQSSVVSASRELDRLGLGSLRTLSFAAAVECDAHVLVCNVFDDARHVRRCIDALESVAGGVVIALALNDQVWEEHAFRGATRRRLGRLGGDALASAALARGAELGLPCHPALGAEGAAALAALVIRFFAAESA
jgi:uncharacterized NAD-dependent epimerase/dehydratase family protein